MAANERGTSEMYGDFRKIGGGSFGTVYRATKGGQYYAVKKIHLSKDNIVKSALREIKYAREMIHHPNLVRIIDAFHEEGAKKLCVVLEYCGGGNLNDHIVKTSPQVPVIIGYIIDIANGINYLHSIKIIHRDLKPANILVTLPRSGRQFCKVADFGLAKAQEPGTSLFQTMCGSFLFTSPEIVKGEAYKLSSDVFSLGLVYFVMLTKSSNGVDEKKLLPFVETESGRQPIVSAVLGDFNQDMLISKYYRDRPALGALIVKMLSLEPKDRPTMNEVLQQMITFK